MIWPGDCQIFRVICYLEYTKALRYEWWSVLRWCWRCPCILYIWKAGFVLWWFDVCCPLVAVPVLSLSCTLLSSSPPTHPPPPPSCLYHYRYFSTPTIFCSLFFPSALFRSQMTSLMFAAKSGYSKVINLLMSYGAEINAQDNYGYTVSHCIIVFVSFAAFDLV